MYVPYKYSYFSWTEPKLTEQEQVDFGALVHREGIDAMMKKFGQDLKKANQASNRRNPNLICGRAFPTPMGSTYPFGFTA
jgi:transposase